MSNGLHRSEESILNELNPLMVKRQRGSDPPAITVSSSPDIIILAPSIIAFPADEQAVLTAVEKPLRPI